MSRKKAQSLPPWQSAAPNGREKAYVKMGLSQLEHPAIRALKPGAFKLYVYMLSEARGGKTFVFPLSEYSKFLSRDGFQKAKAELVEKGLIVVEEDWAHVRKPTVYAFSDAWWRVIHPLN